MTTTTESDFVTVSELAAMWLVSYEHVRNLILRQQLPAHRIAGRIIVARSDADAYLQRTRTVAREPVSQQPVAAALRILGEGGTTV
jgi:hypothetical protein